MTPVNRIYFLLVFVFFRSGFSYPMKKLFALITIRIRSASGLYQSDYHKWRSVSLLVNHPESGEPKKISIFRYRLSGRGYPDYRN